MLKELGRIPLIRKDDSVTSCFGMNTLTDFLWRAISVVKWVAIFLTHAMERRKMSHFEEMKGSEIILASIHLCTKKVSDYRCTPASKS